MRHTMTSIAWVLLWAGFALAASGAPVEVRGGDAVVLEGDRVVLYDIARSEAFEIVSTQDASPPFVPNDLAVAPDGEIYVSHPDAVVHIDPLTGAQTTIASASVGTGAAIDGVAAITFGQDGLLYVAQNNAIDPTQTQLEILTLDTATRERAPFFSAPADPANVTEIFGLAQRPTGAWIVSFQGPLGRMRPISPPSFIGFRFGGTVTRFSVAITDDFVYSGAFRSPIVFLQPGEFIYRCDPNAPNAATTGNPTSSIIRPDGRLVIANGGRNCLFTPGVADRTLVLYDPETDTAEEIFRAPPPASEELPRQIALIPEGFFQPDTDSDGIPDGLDNCDDVVNVDQADLDGNGVGDACNDFEDIDGDDFADALDLCPEDFDPDQQDFDADGLGDVCDRFPEDANNRAAACEADLAIVLTELALCRDELERDTDGDGVLDRLDRCVATPAGTVVDADGCSVDQFCAAISEDARRWRQACWLADWQGPGDTIRRNCRVSRDGCVARQRRGRY